MAEPLRRVEDFKLDEHPDSPNMNVVPPPAPLGSSDRATTAGATERGDYLLHGDEVDLTGRPDHLLEPYDEERERSWPLGQIPSKLRSWGGAVQDGSLRRNLQAYAEEWRDRAADLADNAQHTAEKLRDRVQSNLGDWQRRAAVSSRELKDRSQQRAQEIKFQTERWAHERPAQAIAVCAGIGFVLGVALRLGRSRREF